MNAKHAVLVTLSFVTAAAMAVPTRNIWQDGRDGEISCAQASAGAGWKNNGGDLGNARCPKFQSQPSVTQNERASTARRDARGPQFDMASKKKLMGLMAILVLARASQ
jgi:hypothetical protein